jgi:hypothetical protein
MFLCADSRAGWLVAKVLNARNGVRKALMTSDFCQKLILSAKN